MKRKLARNINKDNQKVNEQIAADSLKVSAVGNKLLTDDALTLDDINELGQRIAEQQEYDKNQLIVCDITALNERLESHKDDDINEKPIFIICHSENNVRATFCIVKLLDKTVCLYQDFSNIQIPENIKNILEQYFDKDIEFKVHAKIAEVKNQKDEDVLSLKILETMMVYLKPGKKKDFIEDFANTKKTFFGWIKDEAVNLKKELFSLVKEGYYKTTASDIDQLSEDREGFLEEFQQFINELPEVPHEFIDCSRKLKEINFDDWDIEESDENDPRLKALEEIHKKMLASFDSYKIMGENYIELRSQAVSGANVNTQEEEKNTKDVPIGMKNIDINMFNVVKIPKDGNCFYAAVADQLKQLEIKNNEADNQPEAYYTHQDLRALAINYIGKNREQEFGKDIEARLQTQNTNPLHGDLQSNIHTIDQYIEFHSKEGAWADSGIIGALAQALDITLRIYNQDNMAGTYNTHQDTNHPVKKIINLQYTGNHYNSLVVRSLFELLPFETKYPKQSHKIKRIFEILNKCERGEKLDKQIEVITHKLGLSKATEKLKGYFASNIIKPQKTINFVESGPWYTDEDMNSYGKVLEKHGVNFDTQFSNRLTKDGIKTLPSIESLIENHPRYISYNIGGRANNDESGIHWIAIVLVKRRERVTVLYKDSKGDWNNSSKAVETLFKEHYRDKVDFIKHSQAEQEDDSSCGPMTINNLEIMARTVKEANDEGKDGISELIRLFKGELGKVAFTTQDQVQNIRIAHLLQNKPHSNLKQDTNVDDLGAIIKKLEFGNNYISMEDGNNFDLATIQENGNCFYAAVADQLRQLEIKNNEADNQPKAYYTHQDLRALTIDYIKINREQEFGKDIEARLQTQNTDPLHGDLPSNIHTIDQYIELHSKEGEWADSGMVGALAQALDITLRIYNQDNMAGTYNTHQDANHPVKKIINLQYTGNHYNSLLDVDMEDTTSNRKEIESCIHKINKYYDQFKDWGVDELKSWSREHKGHLSKNFESADEICRAIAVMDRANELATGGHRLRDTQKAAILIFIQTNAKGHISQINTGEGKTTIISVVAALKVMQGHKSHVITSNNVLAADGVKDKKLFYNLLNITTADNNPDDKYTDGPRACYSKDIVYGSITSFQFDWLRDSFEQLKTLGGIDFNNIWVMLDEIDSLLIDQGSNIAKLSGPFPGMESLRYVYINIWVALAKTEEQVTQQILTQLRTKADELAKDSETNENEKQIKYEEYEDSLRESFLDEIKKQIKNQKDHLINKKILAKHLHQYAEDSIERWIEHAFTAKYQYNENVEYKISKDKDGENIITPVDNQNTGVSMKNTILSNGLHQFLQIKHNLCLTYESLTSCYVSNLDYIKKYGSKLSGVTGTLGSMPERNLLGSVFNLEFSIIPPFKPKQFIQFPGKISADDKFVNDVAIAALGELARTQIENENLEEKQQIKRIKINKPRAVLIVCASILDVEIIAQEIDKEAKAAGLTPKILKYQDEIDAHITESTLDVCDIVIATNLAGRGTDFKTSARLEDNGGLHVIEAFLPCNKRVEDQGLGRTGRQGNKGTGQIITKISELEALGIAVSDNENIDFNKIIARRDELETMRVNDIADNKIIELEFKGQLFNKFSSLYGSLKKNSKTGTNVIKWIYVLRDLKEKWAFWLEKQAYTAENIKKIINNQESWFTKKEDYLLKAVEQEYNKFLKEAEPIINGTISHNPFYSICLSERYLENSIDKSDREKAKSELEHALKISNSSELLYSAYIKLFEIAIDDGGQVLKRYKKAVAKIIFFPLEKNCPDYKKRAIENLKKAEEALKIEHDYLEELISGKNNGTQQEESVLSSIIISEKEESNNNQQTKPSGNPNLFAKHLQARLVCLAAYKGNIESLIKQIKGEEKLENPKDSIGENDGAIIDAKVPRYLSKLDSQNELKKHITNKSVDELEYVGMSSVYQLRKIHDVHEAVLTGAQIQIGAAFALLGSAIALPVLWPVHAPLAGAMISEGITDIITALIQQGQSAFNKKDYIKGKVISYGISILTMGIGAIMSSTKILNKAMNACRSLATKLRAVKGPFARICEFLANRLDKLAVYLELMIEKIEFARKTAMEQAKYLAELKDINKLQQFQQLQKSLKFSDVVMTHGQKITQIVKQSAIGAVKGVVISVATEKIVIASLSKLMTGLQPIIREKVHSAVSAKIQAESKKGKFNNLSDSEINQTITQLSNTSLEEDIKDVSKQIGLGILRHSSNWKMQLATIAFESILTGINITTCTNTICNKFIDSLPNKQTNNNDSDNSKLTETIITQISETISAIIYGQIVAITGKVVVTLPKALYRGYKKHQEKKADEQAITDIRQKLHQIDTADDVAKAENTKCVHDAVSETLGLDNNKGSKQLADATNLAASKDGASIEDAKQLFIQNGIEVTSCGIEDAQLQFKEQGSDRGVVCLSNNQGFGHAIAVTMEDNCLMVTEGGQKISLDQYKQNHDCTNVKSEFIIPKNVNSSTLQYVQHQCNLNRIVNATHPIDYVGQDGEMKFGGEINFGNHKPGSKTHQKLKKQQQEQQKFGKQKQDDKHLTVETRGHASVNSQINSAEGMIIAGNNPAHSRKSHVGPVKGKTSFKDKKVQNNVYSDAKNCNTKQKVETTKEGEKEKRVTTAQVKRYEGYDWCGNKSNPSNRTFQYVKLVEYKDQDGQWRLQTMYPCDKPCSSDWPNTRTQRGLNTKNLNALRGVFPSFYEYTMKGISHILRLRARSQKLKNVIILPEQYIFSSEQSNIIDIFSSIKLIMNNIHNNGVVILAPISLYNKHAVGIMFVSQETKSSQNLDTMAAFYIDPSNEPIPEDLKTIFNFNGYTLEQLPAEHQRYTNCGPEVIENFMLYLTGERLSQEDAIIYNSRLVEQELLSDAASKPITVQDRVIKDNIMHQRFFMHRISNQLVNESLTNEQSVNEQVTTLTIKELEATITDEGAITLKSVEVTPVTTTPQTTNQNSCQNPLSKSGAHLYIMAHKLSNEAWNLESEDNSENAEDSALIAAEKFTKALELYKQALELEPENIAYQQAFNVTSLKIDGNSLFNEGVVLTDIAYQLQLALYENDDTSQLTLLERQQALVDKYQDVVNIYQEAQDRFKQGFILSQDQRFLSCIELVASEIEFVQNHITNLEKLEELLLENADQNDLAEIMQEQEADIKLYNRTNETLVTDNVLVGDNSIISQYIYHM